MGWLFGANTPPAPSTTGAERRPLIGDVNVLEASVGQRGAGKSTLQCIRADELSREYHGAYVVGHSLGARLPRTFPDGRPVPIVYHETIAKLERGLRKAPEKWHILAPPLSRSDRETADDLLRFTIRLSEAIKRKAWSDKHPLRMWRENVDVHDVPATPIIVVIDEGIAIEAAGVSKRESDRWFKEYMYSLRHMHIAMLFAIQNPSARSWHVLDQASAIHVFSIRHRWALQALEAAGATEGEIEKIKRLPTPAQLKSGERKHEHVTLAFDGTDGGTAGDAPAWATSDP